MTLRPYAFATPLFALSLAIMTGCVTSPSSNANQPNANASQSKSAAKSNQGSTGSIEVDTRPPGATVLLVPTDEGGAGEPQSKGLTPTTITDLQPGKYTVHMEKPGHKFAQKEVEVKAGETARVSAALREQ